MNWKVLAFWFLYTSDRQSIHTRRRRRKQWKWKCSTNEYDDLPFNFCHLFGFYHLRKQRTQYRHLVCCRRGNLLLFSNFRMQWNAGLDIMSMYNIWYQVIVVFAVVVCLTRHVFVKLFCYHWKGTPEDHSHLVVVLMNAFEATLIIRWNYFIFPSLCAQIGRVRMMNELNRALDNDDEILNIWS